MALREYKSRSELQQLLDSEIAGERRERLEHNFFENSLKIELDGEFTATELGVFGYPESSPQYFFFVEHSDIQFPVVTVRRPLTGHNSVILDEAVTSFIDRMKKLFAKYSQILLSAEVEIGEAFDRHLSPVTGQRYSTLFNKPTGVFYMTAVQREALQTVNSEAPAGFSFEPVNVDQDGETIHRLWKNGVDVEVTKNRLRFLPSICARNDKGELIGWVMAARNGQISNLFTMPEYRNRGVGKALEISAAKEFARRGWRVFKYVDAGTSVYDGTLRSGLWSLWMKEDEDNNETKMPNYSYFRKFVRD